MAAAPPVLGHRSSRRRRVDAAADGADGGGVSGADEAFRPLICGEEGEDAAAEVSVAVDLIGEGRKGGEARRRVAGGLQRCVRARGGGSCAGFFPLRPLIFSILRLAPLRGCFCNFSTPKFVRRGNRLATGETGW